MTEHHPDTVLRDLGAHLDVPPPPTDTDLTAAVLARLDDPPRTRTRPSPLPRLAAAALALLVALGVAMAVSPEVRAAVLDFLRIGAVQIDQAPPPRPPSTRVELPGERTVTLESAREQADFPIRVPTRLGDPPAVHLAGGDPPPVVTLLYDTVRVDQLDGGLDSILFQKSFHLDGAIPTTVDGARGVWLPGPHPVRYLDRDGVGHEQPPRLAGSTLIWEHDGITYRVEGDLTHAEARAVAESLTG